MTAICDYTSCFLARTHEWHHHPSLDSVIMYNSVIHYPDVFFWLLISEPPSWDLLWRSTLASFVSRCLLWTFVSLAFPPEITSRWMGTLHPSLQRGCHPVPSSTGIKYEIQERSCPHITTNGSLLFFPRWDQMSMSWLMFTGMEPRSTESQALKLITEADFHWQLISYNHGLPCTSIL